MPATMPPLPATAEPAPAEFMTLPEAAELMRVTVRTLNRLIRQGRVRAIRLSRSTVRIRRCDLLEPTRQL